MRSKFYGILSYLALFTLRSPVWRVLEWVKVTRQRKEKETAPVLTLLLHASGSSAAIYNTVQWHTQLCNYLWCYAGIYKTMDTLSCKEQHATTQYTTRGVGMGKQFSVLILFSSATSFTSSTRVKAASLWRHPVSQSSFLELHLSRTPL